jgi:hypothetical protein
VREEIRTLPGLERLMLLGPRLRVVCRDGSSAQGLRQWLATSEVASASVREVEPTLEEALASLITQHASRQRSSAETEQDREGARG